ncbi:hypothetical protein CORC01_12121 [Colletotrichum orchidophilum]|uniref:Uncharacterized protein n=1 Tax=Colletotrichum orchidophilum TaxID=1209926 RepID=A0A1G4AU10_9PEZI|nr:uncharacterized protein CORC01_12121 [Colletotrichum orchidophilum]OHE92542.1 hypothetical protein CORC01_12121 [Colletotrichum orchidophilum]
MNLEQCTDRTAEAFARAEDTTRAVPTRLSVTHKKCRTRTDDPKRKTLFWEFGHQDAQADAGAAFSNGRGTCSARGACGASEPKNALSSAGPLAGNFDECIDERKCFPTSFNQIPQFI